MTAYSTLIADLRGQVRETTANAWTDAKLATYISRGEQWLAQFLSGIFDSGRFHTRDQITLAASTETLDMTDAAVFAKGGANGIITAILTIDILLDGNQWWPVTEMEEPDENLYRTVSIQGASNLVPSYYVQDTDVHILPTASSARTLRVASTWIPAAKGTGGTTQTPAQYDDILIARAAFDALGVQGQSETTFEEKYSVRLSEIEMFECNRMNKGTGRVPRNVMSRANFPMG